MTASVSGHAAFLEKAPIAAKQHLSQLRNRCLLAVQIVLRTWYLP
jgi:hypothetical protein